MADLPTVNALEELKESNKVQLAQLDRTFIKGFSQLQITSESMAKSLASMLDLNLKQLEQDKINNFNLLEKLREDARKQEKPEKKPVEKKDDTGPLAELLNFLRTGGLLAGGALLAGLAGAAVGLRGWEGKAIANLGKIKNLVPNRITDGVKALRTGAFGVFGLDPEGKPVRDARGRFTGERLTVVQQIGQYMQNLKQRTYGLFGLGVDGKPVVATPAWVKKGLPFAEMVGNVVEKIKNGFTSVIQSVGTFFSGTGTGGFIGKALSSIGRFLRNIPIIGQIIGAVFAIFEGLFAAFTTEGTFAQKAMAFFAAAVSDFIGAPLDLLKDVFSWLAGKFGFKETEKFLDSFSIEDELEKFILKPIDYIKSIFGWMGSLFDSDAEKALKNAQAGVDKSKQLLAENEEAIQDAMDMGDYDRADEFRKTREALLKSKERRESNLLDAQKALADEEAKPSFLENIRSMDPTEFLRSLVRGILPDPTKAEGLFDEALVSLLKRVGAYEFAGINAETGEAIQPPPVKGVPRAGAEVDVRSREVASQVAQPNVTVAAPQTSIQTDNSTRVNKTSVASASPRRDKTPWWAGRNYATN